jgi:hypothetical protein
MKAAFWLVPCLLVILACNSLDESLTDVKAGDCVTNPGERGAEITELRPTDCSEPGAVRVTSTFMIEGYTDYPGDAELDRIADERCVAGTATFVRPTKQSWEDADDRLVICFSE